MAVSSIKGCWYKFSARIRNYLDVVDSYYRPPDSNELNDDLNSHHHHHHHHHFHHRHPLDAQINGCGAGGRIHHRNCDLTSASKEDQLGGVAAAATSSAGGGHRASCNSSSRGHSASGGIIGIGNCNVQVSSKPSSRHHQHHQGCTEQAAKHLQRQQQHHHHQATNTTTTTTSTRSQLPPGYSKRKTSLGQVYFVDQHGQKYWYDPSVPKELLCASLNLDSLVGRLSSTWEIRQTPSGKTYYVNHIKKTTQFTDPRLVAYKEELMTVLRHTQGIGNQSSNNNNHNNTTTAAATTINSTTTTSNYSNNNHKTSSNSNSNTISSTTQRIAPITATAATVAAVSLEQRQHQPHQVKSIRELYDKISILRQELLKQQVIAHPCRIDINRKRIFEESFRVVSQMQPRDLKKRLLIKFRGEEGLDYGGVAREWFYLLSREILNPNHGLFQYTSDDIYNLQINPDSGIVYREHLSYLSFCGRIIGMAVFHGHFIEGHFTVPFYKMLLGKTINLGDIENVDPELYRSMCWILENDITNVIDTNFLVQHNALGQLQEHELKENGRNTVVTEENKQEYVSLYINYRCRRGIESQMEALQRGFYELIQPSLLENFDEHELELLIGGLSKINLDDWRLHTKLKNCTIDTPLVKWFWDIVKSYDEDRRARLLQFVTGSPRVPIQGFKALQGVNSELRLFTIHLIRNACTNNLPKSHTCFNRIDLPPYETYEKLRDKLTQAIEETMGFAMQ